MKERNPRVTSDAGARLRSGDDAETVGVADPREETAAGVPADDETADEDLAGDHLGEDLEEDLDEDADGGTGDDDGGRRRRAGGRPSLPLVPVLAVLFVLLLGATAFLWFTRPSPSSVQTADYTPVLEAARSEVVDFTSFDYLTLDDDITRIKKISVGDLRSEGVARLDKSRKDITDAQGVSNTQVVAAAVTRADSSRGTVLMVIQSTQKTKASTQPTVTKFRIQVELEKSGGRWLLSGIKGV
jgi:hypothetical protein